MKRITLVRHGESTWNAERRWQGQSDPPLSPLGEAQAAELAPWFAGCRPDRVECSDLKRAAQTAAIAGAEAHPDSAWRELSVGEWEGLPHAVVRVKFREQLNALATGADVAIGGGESWFDLRRRTRAALDRLLSALPEGGHGVVFCHGGVIMALVSALFDLSARQPRPISALTNTSVTDLCFDDAGVSLLRFNDTHHLSAREPRARNGVLVVRLDAQAAPGERVIATWPPPPDDPTPAVFVASAAERRAIIEAILQPPDGARLGPLDGPAHVRVLSGAATLVDYNQRG